MRPLDQHTAIALALGYTFEDKAITYDGSEIKFRLWRTPDGEGMGRDWPPNYHEDLNAMHEAEKILMADDAMYSQRNFYAHHLGSITLNDNGRGWQPLSNDDCFPILHASAAQRAEAFLRTLDLWKDNK
jgi:hypothetical protein